MRRAIDILFVCAILAFLVLGLRRTLLAPEEVNTYENRYAAQVPAFTVAGWADQSYQDGVESALMDQVPGASTMKSLYNRCTTRYLKDTLDLLAARAGLDGAEYVNFGGMRLFGDHYIVYWPRYVSSVQSELDRKIEALNATFARHPELTFYAYYIQKDTDLDFQARQKTDLSDYLMPRLQLPEEHKGVYEIDDFSQYARYFYRTDGHWCHEGSYAGYRQLVDLLGCAGDPLEPVGDAVLVRDDFSGKKASAIAGEGVFTEPFYAYRFDWPEMTVTINGQPAADYGAQEAYLDGTATDTLSYGGFYGGDNGETILSTGTEGRGKLLVIGESFDNAILKLLATHYDTLYSIDLRYYEYEMGQPFDFSAYVAAHGIDQVLLIGNIDYYIQDTFDPER